MLAISAGPAAADGKAAFAASAFGAIVEPVILTVRMAASAKGRLAAWVSDPASLRTLVEQARTASLAAAATTATTGSIAKPAGATVGRRSAQRTELLASVALPFGRLPALRRMEPVYASMKSGIFDDCRTVTCQNARATLEAVIANGRDRGTFALIAAVNRSVNKLVAYRRDRDTHGVIDYWASPSQTLNAGTGDCEDYAILKMAVLERAGISADQMSLVVLRDQRRGVYHAVLAIRSDRSFHILDNLDQSVRPDTELPDYMPLYSVSSGRGYIYGRHSGSSVLSASAGYDAIAPGEGLDGEMPRPAMPLPASAEGLRGRL